MARIMTAQSYLMKNHKGHTVLLSSELLQINFPFFFVTSKLRMVLFSVFFKYDRTFKILFISCDYNNGHI